MARFQYHWTFERIDKYIKEGRGQGEFENYKPWLTVRDVPSNGRIAREIGTKCRDTKIVLKYKNMLKIQKNS